MTKHPKSSKKRQQPKRYDVNQTLSNTPYRPNTGERRQTGAAAPLKGDKTATTQSHEKQPKLPKDKKRWFSVKKAILIVFILLLAPLLFIGGWDLRNASHASQKMFGSGDITPLLTPGTLHTTDGRTNILLIGYSADDPGHAGAKLTDSIMIVSLSKDKKTGYMLSVPRDLYVDIPKYGSAKINEAYQAGEQQGFAEEGYPTGGIGLLEKVITKNFDIELHYSVVIDYGAVRDIVNALDGVTVTIQSPDPRGIYDPNFKPDEGGPLKLANGPQQIDGPTALRLTRARGSTFGSYGFPRSDFNRTQNQQAVFAAIKSELNWKLVLDPRLNDKIFDAVASNVKTDLELREVLPLFKLLRSIPDPALKQVTLSDVNGKNYLVGYQTRTGQSALTPAAGIKDFPDIQDLVKTLNQQ